MTWVKLNVGGEVFETSLETVQSVIRKFPASKLAKMFESEVVEDSSLKMTGEEDINVNTNNNIYNLDLDPKPFSIVLSWLR